MVGVRPERRAKIERIDQVHDADAEPVSKKQAFRYTNLQVLDTNTKN